MGHKSEKWRNAICIWGHKDLPSVHSSRAFHQQAYIGPAAVRTGLPRGVVLEPQHRGLCRGPLPIARGPINLYFKLLVGFTTI